MVFSTQIEKCTDLVSVFYRNTSIILNMIYQPQEFTLKDGTNVLLKTPDSGDAQKLLDSIIAVSRTTDYLLSAPQDYDKYLKDISKEEDFINSAREGKDYLICVYINNVIVGNSMLRLNSHEKDLHRANIGIAIQKEWQGRGIGSLLFDEMIRIAKAIPEIEQLELDVISANERAKNLYLKKGFVKTGDIPHELKLKNGSYLDGELMVLFLNK